MSDPFREQRFSAAQVRQLLRRAAEAAEADPETAGVERALSRGELERAVAELGLPPSALAEALRDEGEEPPALVRQHSSFIGAPTHLRFERELEGEPSDDDREDLAEEIRDVIGETGSIDGVGKTFQWRLSPVYRGQGRNVAVRLRSRNGRTKISVEEKLTQQATGLFVGLGVGGGIGPAGLYALAVMKLGVVGLIFPILWIPVMLLLARTIFGALVERRERSLSELMTRLRKRAQGWSRPEGARVRVVEDEGAAAEREAEAEDEAASAQSSAQRS